MWVFGIHFIQKKKICIQQIYINLIKYDSKDISNVTKEIKGQICSNMMNNKKSVLWFTHNHFNIDNMKLFFSSKSAY